MRSAVEFDFGEELYASAVSKELAQGVVALGWKMVGTCDGVAYHYQSLNSVHTRHLLFGPLQPSVASD